MLRMRTKNGKMLEEDIKRIRERGEFLIRNWKSEFKDASEPWKRGPSWFFYEEITKKHEEKPIKELLDDRYFFVCIYGALASWGLDRMGKGGPKMRDFEDFKEEILKNKDRLINLYSLRIKENSGELKEGLLGLFDSMAISENKNKTRIVANSKTMHFLLPLQAPIIDREYILRYFISKKFNAYPQLNPKYEREFLSEIIDIYYGLIKKESITDGDPLRQIDKALVNNFRKELGRK